MTTFVSLIGETFEILQSTQFHMYCIVNLESRTLFEKKYKIIL